MISPHLFRHALVIERATPGAVDDYNQPSRSWSTLATIRGLIQPKAVDETAQVNEAGAVVSTHTIFLNPTAVIESDRIVSGGLTYQIDGVRDAAGQAHHLEVDAHVVTA